MQIKELNSQGYEIIMVSSGAVGLGRQRLRYRKLVNSRFSFLDRLNKYVLKDSSLKFKNELIVIALLQFR